jgi:hypothetical protein
MKNREPNQVNFTKMLDRPNLSLSNESKFSDFDRDTPVHSKNKRLRSVSFDKTASRSDLHSEVLSRTVDVEYSPNKELLLTSLGKNVAFHKSRSRPELFTFKDDVSPHSYRFQVISKRPSEVDFTHARPRRKDANVPLFLQDVHSRLAMSTAGLAKH